MLRRLRVDNFKSLINVVFEPNGVNLLTGCNNSGKTALFQGIEFLQLSTYFPIASAAAIPAHTRGTLGSPTSKGLLWSFQPRPESSGLRMKPG